MRAKKIVITALGLLAVAAPAASAADPQLIGKEGSGAVRFLDADLAVVEGSPALPPDTFRTVFSPDHKRFAAVAFESKTVRVYEGTKVARILQLPSAVSNLYWPTRKRLVAVTDRSELGKRSIVHSFSWKTGSERVGRVKGSIVDQARVGRRVRLVTQAGLPDFPKGPRFVVDVRPRGKLLARSKVKLPKGFTADAGVRVSGNLLLATQGKLQALVRIGGGAKSIDLPSGYYDWAGRDLVYDVGHVARIDRKALKVVKVVETGAKPGKVQFDAITPYSGGFIAGFVRERYDANLDLVASNPAPVATQNFAPVLAGDRLYDQAYDCETNKPGVAIADADTGATIDQLSGEFTIGVLGGGELLSSGSDDICD